MTFKEKLAQEHPGKVGDYPGGADGCPHMYGYEPMRTSCEGASCVECWNRQIPSLKAATMAFGNHEVEVPYSGRKPIEYVDTAEFANAEPRILDSGERRQFDTGAVRDIQEGKGRCDLMPLEVICKYFKKPIFGLLGMFLKDRNTAHLYECIRLFSSYYGEETNTTTDCTMFLEVAKHFEEGAKKYGENNWQKGLPVHCYIDSAVRHYLKWLRGDKDEPHDRAFVWNLMCCIWEVDFSPRAKEKDREFNMDDILVKHVVGREPEPGVLYVCNRKPCETCRSDCHCTEHIDSAAMLELNCHDVRYEDCPVGLFLHPVDGVFLKTEGLNAAFHVGLGLSRKFEADTMVTPIKYMFEERERE